MIVLTAENEKTSCGWTAQFGDCELATGCGWTADFEQLQCSNSGVIVAAGPRILNSYNDRPERHVPLLLLRLDRGF